MPSLTLSRGAGEKLLIGDDVVIEVVRVGSHRARLRIVAPSSVRILRAELEAEEESAE